MSKWQPIETAPKDGTVVDLWIGGHPDLDGWRATDVRWCKPHHECAGEYCDMCPDDADEYAWREAVTGYLYRISMATHWMPAPEPPR